MAFSRDVPALGQRSPQVAKVDATELGRVVEGRPPASFPKLVCKVMTFPDLRSGGRRAAASVLFAWCDHVIPVRRCGVFDAGEARHPASIGRRAAVPKPPAVGARRLSHSLKLFVNQISAALRSTGLVRRLRSASRQVAELTPPPIRQQPGRYGVCGKSCRALLFSRNNSRSRMKPSTVTPRALLQSHQRRARSGHRAAELLK